MASLGRVKWTRAGLITAIVVCAEAPKMMSIRQVAGSSMKPTLNPDISTSRDYVFINKTPVTFLSYQTLGRGDIVSIRSVEDPSRVNVKRIIGLPGDRVITRDARDRREITVPEGRIWVEGDEGYRSRDSNDYGPIPLGCVHGRVVGILWPPSRFGMLSQSHSSPRMVPRE